MLPCYNCFSFLKGEKGGKTGGFTHTLIKHSADGNLAIHRLEPEAVLC